MIIDKKKLQRQQQVIYKWLHSSLYGAKKDRQGTAKLITGFGKTFVAILAIKELFKLFATYNIVIVVPANIYEQWNKILNEQFTKKQLIQISLFSISQIVNNKIKIKTDCLIVDELHECYSDEAIKILNGEYIQFKDNLGLTATYEDSKNRHTKIKDIFPVIDFISEQEGIKEGYISPYIEYNLSVELTGEEKEEYARLSKIISENLNKFPKGIGLKVASACLSGGYHKGKKWTNTQMVYGYASSKGWVKNMDLTDAKNAQINDIWNPHKIFGYAQRLMNSIRLRKNILYNAESKYQTCIDICNKFEGIKTILFSQSTSFADKLNLLLNEDKPNSSVVYHSALKTILAPSPKTNKLIKFGKVRRKRLALENIKTGKATRLCTASSLDKGLDIPDLGIGITSSGTSNFTQYKQRKGRSGRIDMFNSDKKALLVNLYVKDTREENWLKERQSKSTNIIHFITSVDEIEFEYEVKDNINLNDV